MLADALCPLLVKRGYAVSATDIVTTDTISLLDVRDQDAVAACIEKSGADIVFHLAAETNVDRCELEKEHANATNARGTENIARACKERDIPMVYISTGAVFDGEKAGGYTELDTPNPISVYGRSKLLGEDAVRALLTKYYIIRAGWMIGGYEKDKKFVWKMVQLMRTKKEIPVVIDKAGSPTFTVDFAQGILAIVGAGKYGTYHCVNKGICTRYDIAVKIREYLGKEDVVLKPVTSDAFPLPAPRGKSEALINHNLSRLDIHSMRPWQTALKEYIDNLKG